MKPERPATVYTDAIQCIFFSLQAHVEMFSNFIFSFFLRHSPQLDMASSFKRFLDHTQRRTTVGRTPLDECLARRRE